MKKKWMKVKYWLRQSAGILLLLKKRQIFFVTTLYLDPESKKYMIRSRTPGWFFSEKDAEDCIRENWGDIYEIGYYNYAMIEPSEEGLYPYNKESRWFKVDYTNPTGKAVDERYTITEVPKPDLLSHVVNFSIG